MTKVLKCPSRTGPATQPSEILEEISRGLPGSAIVQRCTGMCISDYLQVQLCVDEGECASVTTCMMCVDTRSQDKQIMRLQDNQVCVSPS